MLKDNVKDLALSAANSMQIDFSKVLCIRFQSLSIGNSRN